MACFDTAFHRSQPEIAQLYALPRAMIERGVRRYGFHGLSYSYLAETLPDFDPVFAEGRVVVAHLGNGASLCAMKSGRSIATTMGFSALEGLPMGTRCGSIDAGVVFYMLREMKLSAEEAERMLYTNPACSACRAFRTTCASCACRPAPIPTQGARSTCSSTGSSGRSDP